MRRFAVSDLHGHLELFNQIKEYINEDDIVYALGDFGDRGPQPWRTLQAVLDDPQFIYLMGNHDLMLVNCMEEYNKFIKTFPVDLYTDENEIAENIFQIRCNPKSKMKTLFDNGGINTIYEWACLSKEGRDKYYWKLKTLPLEIRLAALDGKHFIYLTHVGLTPHELEGENVEDFVWDRLHFYNKWHNSNKHLSIGGHTPIEYVINHLKYRNQEYELKEGCLFYDDDSKICIDRWTCHTKETVLLDIDTLKGKVFKIKEVNNESENNG